MQGYKKSMMSSKNVSAIYPHMCKAKLFSLNYLVLNQVAFILYVYQMGPALFCRSHQACAHPGAPWCVQVARECPLLHGASRWYAYSRRNICYLSFRKDDKMSLQEFG
ncbi:hypothetical protein BS78_K248600 [Paspalum vaginatum]|uniref:Uncharacterized protein n=1 Tax=Paspalum vaginatum TaxID=158149 RepID=A0A9W7XEC2_9POAL|nr:hypothetical protein BS78_K248600 [Paspalum vaginatum]